MNKHTFIAYIINALILLFVSGFSVILSRKYNFTSLITETFQQGKELEISDSEIEQEFYPDSANLSKPLPIKEDLISDSSDNIEYIKQLISDKNFVIEVFSTFSVLLIGSTLFTIFR
jgi:hypothetical protein